MLPHFTDTTLTLQERLELLDNTELIQCFHLHTYIVNSF